VAAAVFTLEARRDDDEMLRWFGPACVLGAFSRADYLLAGSVDPGWLSLGDVVRTGCYVLLLVGAAREIRRFRAAQPAVAVAADRRRLARELHDGVVQELGFIRAEAHGLDHGPTRQRILDAAARGLTEARAAVDALASGSDASLPLLLHAATQQVAELHGVRTVVEFDDSVAATPDQAHALVRIAREAMGNAVRHGGARTLDLRLTRDQRGYLLVVADDGSGFEPAETGSTGYGLTSMRDRAAGLPGALELTSRRGGGTTVTVRW
jgi:signal transduction histidine kinase